MQKIDYPCRMNSEWIETFLDIYETRNFNTSALNLNVTQSTISHRIQKLEAALGTKLFQRGRQGAEPTAAGHGFVVFARNLQREWNQARHDLRANRGRGSSLRVGIQYDLAKVAAGEVLATIRGEFPNTPLYIEVDYSRQMTRDIARGDLDFALIFTPNLKPEIYIEAIGVLDYLMVAAVPRAFADLDPADYIFPNISPAFAAAHVAMHPHLTHNILHCGQSDAIAQFIQIRGGASYVIAGLARELLARGLHAVAGAPVLQQDLFFATHISNRTRAEFRRLRTQFARMVVPLSADADKD